MKRIVEIFFVFVFILFSCNKESGTSDDKLLDLLSHHSPTGDYNYFKMPESLDLNRTPNQDVKNQLTKAKAELGKMLFFETGLGLEAKQSQSMETYSCSSCHIPAKGFTAGRFQGIGDGAIGFGIHGEGRKKSEKYVGADVDAQGARPLPTINLAYVTNALWAGAFGSFGVNVGTEKVWKQDTLIEINFKQLEGLEANNQRALIVHRQVIDKSNMDRLGYTAFFDKAFPEIPPANRYNRETGGMAIAAYQRTIFTNKAPFQLWLKGDKSALTRSQKEGAVLFFTKAGCINCHKSPSFNSMEFQAVGVFNLYQSGYEVFRTDASDARNFGRGGFTKNESDMFKYKVPQLYNLKDVGFYFHGASKKSLKEVVEYFNKAIPENSLVPQKQISEYFKPLNLSELEVDQLTDFLANALFDPNLERYAPLATMSGNCFPDNDPISQKDLGCK